MKAFPYLLLLLTCLSCSKNSVNDENCRFLLNVGVNVPINLNLPEYGNLQSPGNSVYIPNAGNAGIIVANVGFSYMAWDASDPNHPPSSCSALSATGLEGTCGCDDNKYSLVTGQALQNGTLRCSLKSYRIEQSGNTLLVTN
jgi:nitrite reductase/ring-hydroxylating ferredoxin subunit